MTISAAPGMQLKIPGADMHLNASEKIASNSLIFLVMFCLNLMLTAGCIQPSSLSATNSISNTQSISPGTGTTSVSTPTSTTTSSSSTTTSTTSTSSTTTTLTPGSATSSPFLGLLSDDQPHDLADAAVFANYLGKPAAFIMDQTDGRSWQAFDADLGAEAPLYRNQGMPVIWSIPLTVSGTSLADIASGAYDSHFLLAAQEIQENTPGSIIRLGWEFNGNWFQWSVGVAGTAQDYINAFRHVVGIFRSVSPNFKFDWCTNWGFQYSAPDQAYPGDDVVDYIGLDNYDGTGNAANDWQSYVVDTAYGLAWHASFATQHGKPMTYPEWGAGQNGDDPAFIQNMYDWIHSHNVAYTAYWDNDTGGYAGSLTSGQLPLESAIFKKLFGAP